MPTGKEPVASGAVGWETVHVFVSSTFSDMHAERDFLVKKVFPNLQDWCERRKLRLVDIDLRWGVTEADATRNSGVIQVCLDRIDLCRPFFLCLLGQRYGWIPLPEDISKATHSRYPGVGRSIEDAHSVTEMEILHAIVRPFHGDSTGDDDRDRRAPVQHAFFYLRDPLPLDAIGDDPPALKRIYSDEAEPDPGQRAALLRKLAQLRDVTIPGTGRPVRSYRARWRTGPGDRSPELALPLRCSLSIPENVEGWRRCWRDAAGIEVIGQDITGDPHGVQLAQAYNARLTAGRLGGFACGGGGLGDQIFADMTAAIAQRYPAHREIAHESDLQRELDHHEQFVHTSAAVFIERGDDFGALDRYLADDSGQVLVVAAPGGMGKSTLLAAWVGRTREGLRGAHETIHARFCGMGELSTSIPALIRYLLLELRDVAGKIDGDIPAEPGELHDRWRAAIEACGRGGRTVIVMEGLDHLDPHQSELDWIPAPLPSGVKIVVSFRTGEPAANRLAERLGQDSRYRVASVGSFDALEDRRLLVRTYLSQYLKELDDHHLEALIRVAGAENPLFLRVVLSELRVFGSFDKLAEQIEHAFGADVTRAFAAVLARLESDPAFSALDMGRATALVFGYLAHARHGLSVDDLAWLLGREDAIAEASLEEIEETIHLLLRQVRPYLSRRAGRYHFFYEDFRRASLRRYVAPADGPAVHCRSSSAWHSQLADLFRGRANGAGIAPWDGAARGDMNALAHHLLHAGRGQELSELYSDFDYLLALCCLVDTPGDGDGPMNHAGIFDLLTNLQEGREHLRGHPIDGVPGLLGQLEGTFKLLADRAGMLQRFPHLVTQELFNYLDLIGAGESLEAVRRQAGALPPDRIVARRKTSSSIAVSGHAGRVSCMAAMPTPGGLLSGSRDGSVALWQLGEERPRWVVQAHKGKVTWASVNQDGRHAVSVGEDGVVLLWDLAVARSRRLQVGDVDKTSWTYAFFGDFLPDGSVVILWGGQLFWIDPRSGRALRRSKLWHSLGRNDEEKIAYHAPGARLYLGGNGREIRVIDASTGDVVATHSCSVRADHLQVSADGSRLMVASPQGVVLLLDSVTGVLLDEAQTAPMVTSCRAAEGKAFFSWDADPKISRLEAASSWRIQTAVSEEIDRWLESDPRRAVCLADNRSVAFGHESGAISVYDWKGQRVTQRWEQSGALCMAGGFPGGCGVFGVQGPVEIGKARVGDRLLRIDDSGVVRILSAPPHRHRISAVRVLNRSEAVTADRGGCAVLWKGTKPQQVFRISDADFTACAAWPDLGVGVGGTQGDQLVVFGKGGQTQTHDVPSHMFPTREGISALAVSGLPLRFLAGYFNGDVRFSILDPQGSRKGWIRHPIAWRASAVALAPDVRYAASGNSNGSVFLWDPDEGEQLAAWSLHQGEVVALAFRADGEVLYTAGADGRIHGIALPGGEIVKVTQLPQQPLDLAWEEGDWLTVVDIAGTVYRFSCSGDGQQRRDAGRRPGWLAGLFRRAPGA
ncbi:MAG: DUF4062 domain-containing protein [Pseudomonadota bacterium]